MNEGRQVKIGEFLGRVGIVLFFTIVATLKGISIAQLLTDSSVTPADNWLLVLLSNFASLVYLCLVIAVAVFRLKPSRGAQGIERRWSHCASELRVRAIEHRLGQAELLQETANRRGAEARGKR